MEPRQWLNLVDGQCLKLAWETLHRIFLEFWCMSFMWSWPQLDPSHVIDSEITLWLLDSLLCTLHISIFDTGTSWCWAQSYPDEFSRSHKWQGVDVRDDTFKKKTSYSLTGFTKGICLTKHFLLKYWISSSMNLDRLSKKIHNREQHCWPVP